MTGAVYLGTSEFAATVLEVMCERGERPELVITPPDRRRGRGRRSGEAPVAAIAEGLGLPVLKTADVNGEQERSRIAASGATSAMVCAFGQIIREPLLSDLLMLNVHPSLLPRWRGAAPIERAIMAGDAETGVCVMQLEAGLDSGPVALTERVAIEPGENAGELSSRLARLGGEMAATALLRERRGELTLVPQPERGVTYAEKIEKDERRLDPARSAIELAAVVRALTPHIGAYLELENGVRLGVLAAQPLTTTGSGTPGELLTGSEAELDLACGKSTWLRLETVQPQGKRPMASADYLRGHQPPARVVV